MSDTRPLSANTHLGVTPSDTLDVTGTPFTSLWIGGAGAVTIVSPNGVTATYAAVPVGMLYVAGKRVMATGTTATNIVAVFS